MPALIVVLPMTCLMGKLPTSSTTNLFLKAPMYWWQITIRLNAWALVPRSGELRGLKVILWDVGKFFMSQLSRHHCFRFDSIVVIKVALSWPTIRVATSHFRLSPFQWMIARTVSLRTKPSILSVSISHHATTYKVHRLSEKV